MKDVNCFEQSWFLLKKIKLSDQWCKLADDIFLRKQNKKKNKNEYKRKWQNLKINGKIKALIIRSIKCKNKINMAQNIKVNLNKNLYSNDDMIFNTNFKKQKK